MNKLHFDFPIKWWPENILGFKLLWELQDPIIHYSSTVTDKELLNEIDGVNNINKFKNETSYV